jgi:predicted component of type VI protein secretion system
MFLDLSMIARGVEDEASGSLWGWLDRDGELRVGPYTITRLGSPQRELSRPRRPADHDLHDQLPAVDLEFLTDRGDARQDQSWRIAGAVSLVGASRQCDLWLRDESVSKVHASLVLTPRGLWVVDLLGRGSVLVNGRPAYWKQIHDGARLQIGRYRFRVRFENPRGPADQRHDDRPPEVLAAPDRLGAPPGGLSEQSVMTLIGHMADMQNQFFEHSQNQMRFMAEMLAHMGRTQQASVRQDMARIEEITRELQELKAQLAAQPASGAPRRKRKAKSERRKGNRASTGASSPASHPPEVAPSAISPAAFMSEPAPTGPAPEPSASVSGNTPRAPVDHARRGVGENAGASEESRLPPASAEAHARLTERMARLAKERNAGWRRILAALTGKPAGQ